MSQNPQKIIKGRYQVVPRTIIFVIHGNEVLLQKGSDQKKIFPGYLNGIGGHLERGEDVLSGARRELFEEAHIDCEDLCLAGTIMIDVEPEQGILLFVMTGENITGNPQGSDEGTLEWIPVEQLNARQVLDDIPELVTQVIKFRKTGKIFFAKYLYTKTAQRIATFY